MTILCFTVPLAFQLLLCVVAQTPRPKVECGDIGFTSSEEDCEIAKEAKKINGEKCPPEEIDPAVRDMLEASLHGENLLKNNLETAKDNEEFNENLNEDIVGTISNPPGSLMWPWFIIIGLFLWFLLGGCAMCPCCRCCRCCKKERESMSILWKGIFFALLLVCLIGIIIGLTTATGGGNWLIEGWDTIQCTLTTLVGTLVSGNDPTWPTEKVNGLVDKLGPNHPFMVDTRSILLATEPVERSVKMLTGTLTLLDTVMGQPENVRPVSNSGEDLNHICHLCQGVTGKIAPVADRIDGSLGKALEKARKEVNDKLSGKELEDLQDTLRKGVDPMNEVRDGVMDSIGKDMIKEDGFQNIADLLGFISFLVFLLCILGFLPFCCGCCAVSLAAFKPLRSQPSSSGNIYRSSPKWCACCSWCLGIGIASLLLFLGFLFSAITIPISSFCIVLDDLNGETYDKWAPALGADKEAVSEEDWQNTLNVVDACTNRDAPGEILNVLTVEDSKKGRITIREKLVQETRDRINAEFDKIQDRKTESSMLEDDGFKDMFKLLDMPVEALTTFDPDRIASLQSETKFVGFALHPDLATTAFATSAGCDDVAVDKDGPLSGSVIAGTTVPGIRGFREAVKAKGMFGSCPGSTCTCNLNGGDQKLREAANSILEIKEKLRSSRKYRCDLFVGRNGVTCDPKDFTPGGLKSDCVTVDDGKMQMKVKEISCSYPEFVQYVKDFRKRLEVAVTNLEDEAVELLPAIAEGLKDHIDSELLDNILEIVDGVNCAPFKNTFHGAIDGVCYHFARGLIDIGEGFKTLGMFVVILNCLTYYFWRRVADNISERKRKVAIGEAPVEVVQVAGGPQQAAVGDKPNQVDA